MTLRGARHAAFIGGACLVLAACGGSAPTQRLDSERVLLGDEREAEAVVVGAAELPALPIVLRGESSIEEARQAANAVTAVELAAPPRDADLGGMNEYVEQTLAAYLNACAERLRELQGTVRALEDTHGVQTDEASERTLVGAALLGSALVQVARTIRNVELPAQVNDQPSRRAPIREALDSIAYPIFVRARNAFAACSERAVRSADPEIDAYRSYCDDEGRSAGEIVRTLRPREAAPGTPPSPSSTR